MYGVVLSLVGRVELAVTTNLNVNFLRRPAPGDVVAEVRILKLGRRLAVGEDSLAAAGDGALVAHILDPAALTAGGISVMLRRNKRSVPQHRSPHR